MDGDKLWFVIFWFRVSVGNWFQFKEKINFRAIYYFGADPKENSFILRVIKNYF